MTSKWLIALVVVLAVLIILALVSRKSVRAELTVDATPDEVWAVISDPTSYPAWNPILTAVSGNFVKGAVLDVDMTSPDGSVAVVKSRVVKVDPGAELNQAGGIPGILTFNHTWRLEPAEGGTRVTQYEYYRGIGVLFWDPEWVETAYRQANINLRDALENR